MMNTAAAYVVFHLLGSPLPLGRIEPEDIIDMWHDLDADDDRILYYLRIALPSRTSGPVPPVPGLSFTAKPLSEGWPSPIALEVTFQGCRQHLDEAALVAVARDLLAADDAPAAPGVAEMKGVMIDRPSPPVVQSPAPPTRPKSVPAQLSLF